MQTFVPLPSPSGTLALRLPDMLFRLKALKWAVVAERGGIVAFARQTKKILSQYNLTFSAEYHFYYAIYSRGRIFMQFNVWATLWFLSLYLLSHAIDEVFAGVSNWKLFSSFRFYAVVAGGSEFYAEPFSRKPEKVDRRNIKKKSTGGEKINRKFNGRLRIHLIREACDVIYQAQDHKIDSKLC